MSLSLMYVLLKHLNTSWNNFIFEAILPCIVEADGGILAVLEVSYCFLWTFSKSKTQQFSQESRELQNSALCYEQRFLIWGSESRMD